MVSKEYKDCDVCLAQLKGHNKEISCVHCNQKCCKFCAKTYILGSNNEAKCMHNKCDKPWSREFLIENFGYTFVNTQYKKHREQLLYDIEVAKFEETMSIVASRKELYETKDKLKEINEKIKNYNTKDAKKAKEEIKIYIRRNSTPTFKTNNNLDNQIEFLTEMLKRKVKLKEALKQIGDDNLENLKDKRWKLQQKIWRLENSGETKIKKEKFFGHCPETDCKGLIKSNSRCVVCEILVCKSCKVKIADKDTPEEVIKENKKNHTCNENDLKSMEEVKKMCKPCPNCKIPITRSEGCSQMWCTMCHTIFSWTTEEVVTTGAFHNPHYLEWRRKTGGNPNENIIGNCGTRLSIHNLNINGYSANCDKLRQLCYFLEDLRYRYLRNLNTIINEDKTLEFRIQFIRNNLTEKKFRQKLQIEEKKKAKLRDHYMILDMFDNTCQEYLQGFKNDRQYNKLFKIIEELLEYTNESFKKLKSVYKNKIPKIEIANNGRYNIK